MADIFLSYAREDRERARRLAEALALYHWTVFWDRNIRHGTDFNAVIQTELDNANCIVVLWSRSAIESRFVRDEANEGLNDGRVVPTLIETVRQPLGFRQLQAADLATWDGSHRQQSHETSGPERARPEMNANTTTAVGGARPMARRFSALLLVGAVGLAASLIGSAVSADAFVNKIGLGWNLLIAIAGALLWAIGGFIAGLRLRPFVGMSIGAAVGALLCFGLLGNRAGTVHVAVSFAAPVCGAVGAIVGIMFSGRSVPANR